MAGFSLSGSHMFLVKTSILYNYSITTIVDCTKCWLKAIYQFTTVVKIKYKYHIWRTFEGIMETLSNFFLEKNGNLYGLHTLHVRTDIQLHLT